MSTFTHQMETDFFDIVVVVLQEDTLASYLFIICLHYILQMLIDLIKEKGLTLKKARNRWYSRETIMDAYYIDDTALLANTPTRAEFLQHSLEQAAGGIGLHVNADKIEYMYFNADKMEYLYFNQKRDITLNGGSLKLVDK